MWQPSPLSVPVPTQDICSQIGCASFVATLHFWTIFCCVWSSYWWLFFTRSNCIEIFSLLTPNLLSLSLGLFSSNYSFSDQIKGGTAQSSLVAGLLKSSWFIQATVATIAAGTPPSPVCLPSYTPNHRFLQSRRRPLDLLLVESDYQHFPLLWDWQQQKWYTTLMCVPYINYNIFNTSAVTFFH